MRVMRFGYFILLGLFRAAESKEFDLLGGEESDSDLLKIKSESDFWNVEESTFENLMSLSWTSSSNLVVTTNS